MDPQQVPQDISQEQSHSDSITSANTEHIDDNSLTEGAILSKKAKKKLEKQLWKAQKSSEHQQEQNELLKTQQKTASDFEVDDFGYLPLITSQTPSTRVWSDIHTLTDANEGETVWVRARLNSNRKKGSLCFILLRQKLHTIQAILDTSKSASKQMIQWTAAIPVESVVDVMGVVKVPDIPITSTSQAVELEVKKIFCSSKSLSELPIQVKDINRVASEEEETINVNQDTRLDNRIIDLRGICNMAIFKVQSVCCQVFRNYLLDYDFVEIHTPKILGGASEGGSSCFSFKYFEQMAFLAQSPQLYKQMMLNSDFDRVFEIGPIFRAENSNTHRHLCEYVGLDMEMTFKENYFEVINFIDNFFKHLFSHLTTNCAQEISIVNQYNPTTPFEWLQETPIITFEEGINLLKKNGCDDIPDDITEYDISTEKEKLLGKIIKQIYKTDFYILYKYPTKTRAFYSMPSPDNPAFCNSYDFFVRGEEILSGAQRIHDPTLLKKSLNRIGVTYESLKFYVDSFQYGAFPHAGCGIGLERLVMLFLGLTNIRKASLFPRDPKRITP